MEGSSSSIEKNFEAIKTNINDACRVAKRDPHEVKLIAVSKGHDFYQIKTLYELGQRDFGESYAQEFIEKRHLARLAALDIRWHFLGAIQSNKIKLIKEANYVHSIGSVRHAELLNNALDKITKIFLQINLDGDKNRQGFLLEHVKDKAQKIAAMKNLEFIGLMTILPQDHSDRRFWFETMSDLKQQLEKSVISKKLSLSMGMSDDFMDAIAYGADYIRIGTKIFGARSCVEI
jgi:pyridoxal phosphate enzyme (YggS family)